MKRVPQAILIFAALIISAGHASFVGIPDNYPIHGDSRPCCSFAPSFLTSLMGIFKIAEPSAVGDHDFGSLMKDRKVPTPPGTVEEEVGQVFTCRAGFIDLSHLRDTADWSATIYRSLISDLGKGVSLTIKKEGGMEKATLELPPLSPEQTSRLSREDIARMAVALTFDLALFHEIATSFPMAVSGPKVLMITDKLANERSSSFSVEDAYSNLLGSYLGTQAADDGAPFNEAMTRLLNDTLDRYGARQKNESKRVLKSLKGTWWKSGPFKSYRSVRARTFSFEDTLSPRLPVNDETTRYCGEKSEGISLDIPSIEKITGLQHSSVAYIRVVPTAQYARKLKKIGAVLNEDGSFTRDQFGYVIPKIQETFSKRIRHIQATP